ncbi:hypothetical protein GCM10020000_39700 [Streptomyces olivoverticillatus]
MVKILATEAGIAIGNARVHEEGRQRMRWIDGSVAVTTALLSGSDAEDALSVVAEQARRLADSAAGIVLLPDGEGGLEMVAVSADEPAGLLGTVMPPHSPVVSQLLAGEPVFVDDSSTDPRMITDVAPRFGPSMLLPLKSGDRVLGTLATPRARGARPYTATERTLAAQFAAQAALALVLAEAQRDRERLAVFEDRDRIARDLHDLVIQRLFATGLLLESAQRKAGETDVRDKVGQAVEELDVTIQEIRTAIFALQQGPSEAPAGLRTRVLRELGTAAVPLGFQPSAGFVGPVDAKVGELTGKNLIAALREALSNAFRHARASRIEVLVDATATLPDGREAVRLTVADDGVGIPEGGRRSGLRNLAKRAESLGGSSSYGPGIGEDGGRHAGGVGGAAVGVGGAGWARRSSERSSAGAAARGARQHREHAAFVSSYLFLFGRPCPAGTPERRSGFVRAVHRRHLARARRPGGGRLRTGAPPARTHQLRGGPADAGGRARAAALRARGARGEGAEEAGRARDPAAAWAAVRVGGAAPGRGGPSPGRSTAPEGSLSRSTTRATSTRSHCWSGSPSRWAAGSGWRG